MVTCDLQEPLKIFRLVRTTLDGQEIDDLNEELRPSVAGFAHGVDQLFQSREKSIVTDAQQRPARNVANAGSFYHQRGWLPLRKTAIPVKVVLGNEAITSGAPWDHRRDPRATRQRQRTDVDWLK